MLAAGDGTILSWERAWAILSKSQRPLLRRWRGDISTLKKRWETFPLSVSCAWHFCSLDHDFLEFLPEQREQGTVASQLSPLRCPQVIPLCRQQRDKKPKGPAPSNSCATSPNSWHRDTSSHQHLCSDYRKKLLLELKLSQRAQNPPESLGRESKYIHQHTHLQRVISFLYISGAISGGIKANFIFNRGFLNTGAGKTWSIIQY